MIGSQLGNYRVEARLGEGGMGTVYRAVDTMLDRDVALKVLRPELARQAALVERFRAEAVALARLRHEHIAALYGLDRQGDELVMVMEYVSGETLESRLARTGTMPWQEAIPVVRDVLAALGHAHVRGVVHRDIKPANVMIDAEGVVKVMDFGIARLIGENRQTRAGVAVGTPSYMAPEQLRGEDVDGRTDLYAAGALLFELLTGRVAFQADSDYALMMQQLHEPPPAPSSVKPGIPRALDGAVARAMSKKPAQRYGTATDFARALEAIAPESALAEPIRDVAASVAAKAPRDWRVYAIGACVVAAASLGVAAMRDRVPAASEVRVSTDTATSMVAVNQTAQATPSSGTIGVETGSVTGASGAGPVTGATVTPEPVSQRAPGPTPAPDNKPPARTPARAAQRTPAEATTPKRATPAQPTNVAPPRTETNEPPPRAREDAESPSAVGRRAQDLLQRCVSAISSNDGGTAGRLLSGQTSGLLGAVNDGRIASASVGGIDVDPGADRVTARGSVRISWRTAFGGNKSGTASLTAAVTRSGDGWRAAGCSVGSDGGVK